MKKFKVGDLIQFIPENFDRSSWNYYYIGVGYIEAIDEIAVGGKSTFIYKIYFGSLIRQQMNNFTELELKATIVNLTEKQISAVCRLATVESLNCQ